MNIDYDYLTEIGRFIPNSGSRWGCSFDGQRLALVGYALCNTGEHRETSPGMFEACLSPMVFFATAVSGVSMSRAVRVFDQIALSIGDEGLSLQMKGALGRREVFIRHLRSLGGRHGVTLFSEGQGRWFEETEVITAVADDKEENLIRLAPEFQDRPERVLLDEEIALIDPRERMSPLQEAFVYGLGEWSCKTQRRKFHVGATTLSLY